MHRIELYVIDDSGNEQEFATRQITTESPATIGEFLTREFERASADPSFLSLRAEIV